MNQSPFLLPVIVAGALYVFGQYISSEPERVRDNMITVQATGKASSVPDIARVTLGVQIQPQPTAAQATDMLAKQMNTVLAAMKALGIEEKDLKTQNISIQPTYNYEDGKQTLRGFEGNEQLEVTIRKTDQAGAVIAKGAESGANQIGGVQFVTDDSADQYLEAEKDAIVHARKKAEDLAQSLGVRLGKVRNYSAHQQYGGPIPYAAMETKSAMGGDTAVSEPAVRPGTNENSVTVSITYDIR